MRRFLIVLILFLGIVFVILSFSELQQIIATLERANPRYLALALIVQAGWFGVIGLTYRSMVASNLSGMLLYWRNER